MGCTGPKLGYRPTYMHIELQVHKWVAQDLCWDIGLHAHYELLNYELFRPTSVWNRYYL